MLQDVGDLSSESTTTYLDGLHAPDVFLGCLHVPDVFLGSSMNATALKGYITSTRFTKYHRGPDVCAKAGADQVEVLVITVEDPNHEEWVARVRDVSSALMDEMWTYDTGKHVLS